MSDRSSGRSTLEAWAIARFPSAEVRALGFDGAVEKWVVDFGPDRPGLRISVTTQAIDDEATLAARIHDLESGRWLDEVEAKSKWISLNALRVAHKTRENW